MTPSKKPDLRVLVIRETLTESIISDLITLIVIVLLIGLGVFLQSAAMEWIGFFMACVFLIGQATMRGRARKIFTIAEARRRLDEIERDLSDG